MLSVTKRRIVQITAASAAVLAVLTLGGAAYAATTLSVYTLTAPEYTTGIDLTSQYLYTANGHTVSRVNRLNLADETDYTVPSNKEAFKVASVGTRIFAATSGGVAVFDTTVTGGNPFIIPATADSYGAVDIATWSGHIYAAHPGRWDIVSSQLIWDCVITVTPITCTSIPMSVNNPQPSTYQDGPRILKVSGDTLIAGVASGALVFTNLVTGSQVTALFPGAWPIVSDIAVANGKAYALGLSGNYPSFDNFVYTYDIATGLTAQAPAALPGNNAYSIAYGGGYLYISKYQSNVISQLDADTKANISTFDVADRVAPSPLTFDNGTLYTGSHGDMIQFGGASVSTLPHLVTITGLPQTTTPTPTPTVATDPTAGSITASSQSESLLANTGISSIPLGLGIIALALGLLLVGTRRKNS
jgi:hypothetical protein